MLNKMVQSLIDGGNQIRIYAGPIEKASFMRYSGTRAELAIKRAVTSAKIAECTTEAHAVIYSHDLQGYGSVWLDVFEAHYVLIGGAE